MNSEPQDSLSEDTQELPKTCELEVGSGLLRPRLEVCVVVARGTSVFVFGCVKTHGRECVCACLPLMLLLFYAPACDCRGRSGAVPKRWPTTTTSLLPSWQSVKSGARLQLPRRTHRGLAVVARHQCHRTPARARTTVSILPTDQNFLRA